MQAAYLRRDKIPVGTSTAVLIMKFFCFQCAFVLCSVISFLCMFQKLSAENPGVPFQAQRGADFQNFGLFNGFNRHDSVSFLFRPWEAERRFRHKTVRFVRLHDCGNYGRITY